MSRNLCISVSLGALLLAVIAYFVPPSTDEPPGKRHVTVKERKSVFLTVCADCHGGRGQGIRALMTPSIASLPRWYLEAQIRKFRNGQRGAHPADVNGQTMRAAVMELTDDQIDEAVDYIGTLPAVAHEPTLHGDVTRGYTLYRENCMACHRFNGHGEKVFQSASLNGLQDWYLVNQLHNFEKGIRGYHKDDEGGKKMRKAVGHIRSHQDKVDILALVAELAKKYPVVKTTKQEN